MNTNFLTSGARTRIASGAGLKVAQTLAKGTYELKFDPQTGEFFLEQVDGLQNPTELYGDVVRRAERILTTFEDRKRNTGVLLTGLKGAGKSLLAREIAIRSNLPIILVNLPYSGPEFNGFLAAISQPVVIMLDEFDKVFEETDKQNGMLTILDGMYGSNKLFVVTLNDPDKVVDAMKNRPGRFFYHYDYKSVTKEALLEYAKENLMASSIKAAQMESLEAVFDKYDSFNFDMLKAVVEEMNRYNEMANEVLEHLNIHPESSDWFQYTFAAKLEGHTLVEQWGMEGNPLTKPDFRRTFQFKAKSKCVKKGVIPALPGEPTHEEDDEIVGRGSKVRQVTVNLSAENLVKFDAEKSTFTFVNQGVEVVMSRVSKFLM